jgi:hypothetical protein
MMQQETCAVETRETTKIEVLSTQIGNLGERVRIATMQLDNKISELFGSEPSKASVDDSKVNPVQSTWYQLADNVDILAIEVDNLEAQLMRLRDANL